MTFDLSSIEAILFGDSEPASEVAPEVAPEVASEASPKAAGRPRNPAGAKAPDDRPKRVRYTPEEPLPENTVCVTRPGPFGNPYLVEEHGRVGACQKFEEMVMASPEYQERVIAELGGKDLACYCGPRQKCHADILLRIANPEIDFSKKSSKAKPPKPLTPSAFAALPAPAAIPYKLLNTLGDVEALVSRWLADPPRYIGFDIETTGLVPTHGAEIRLIQLLPSDDTVCQIIDVTRVGEGWVGALQPLFAAANESSTFVVHNADFEVLFLTAAGIRFGARFVCTLTAEMLLSKGVLPIAQRSSEAGSGLSLADVAGRRLRLNVEKALQTSDWSSEELTEAQFQYAALDARLALDVWASQRPAIASEGLAETLRVECRSLLAIAQVRLTGYRFDVEAARELAGKKRAEIEQLKAQIQSVFGIDNANSTKQLAEAIGARGVKLPCTAAGNPSVDSETLGTLVGAIPEVELVLQLREATKTLRTYLEGWIELAEGDPSGQRRILPQLKPIGAVTGRMSCPKGDLARSTTAQGIPDNLRHLFGAPEGYSIVAADLSAIEHRLCAAIYGERAYVEIYTKGLDPYCYLGNTIFGREITKADKAERSLAKIVFLGMQYGSSWKSVKRSVEIKTGTSITEKEAKRLHAAWDKSYPVLAKKRDAVYARQPDEVTDAIGRKMRYGLRRPAVPGVSFSYAVPTPIGATNALAFPIQGSAASLFKTIIGNLVPKLWEKFDGRVTVLHLIHDEIHVLAPDDDAEEALEVLLETMQDPELAERFLKGVLPLVADGKIGKTYADVH